MSTESSKIEKIIQTRNNGSYSITTIKTYWSNMNPLLKKVFIGYGCIAVSCYTVYNYADGSRTLKNYRITNPKSTPAEEWSAVRNGINSFDNFWSSLFFPWSITNKVMPAFILMTNPKIEKIDN